MNKIFLLLILSFPLQEKLPKGFVYLSSYSAEIIIDIKYATKDNFVGNFIAGYYQNKAITTKETAIALVNVQNQLKKHNLGLIIYDAYRPKKAVNHFVNWSKAKNDTLTKSLYYPNLAKKDLFNLGFISSRSRHSSGSTVDVSLINLKTKEEIDMGSPYDYFGEESHINYTNLTSTQLENRKLLQYVMLSNGFRNYAKEWWHFTLKNEPFKNQFFNFNVE